MDSKLTIGIIAVAAIVIIAAAAFCLMNNGSDNTDPDTNKLEIKQTFQVGDTHTIHVSGTIMGMAIDEDEVVKIIQVNSDGTYQVQIPDEEGGGTQTETMTRDEIVAEIAPSIADLNKKIKEESGMAIELKKVGTEVIKVSGFGDLKCDKYSASVNQSGSTVTCTLYLESSSGVLVKMESNISASGMTMNVTELLSSSTMVGIPN